MFAASEKDDSMRRVATFPVKVLAYVQLGNKFLAPELGLQPAGNKLQTLIIICILYMKRLELGSYLAIPFLRFRF